MGDKLTDNEIVKVLECCIKGDCENCNREWSYNNQWDCMRHIQRLSFNLINRLQAENNNLFYKLLGVMHSVDKWLDGDELKQDEVNRGITMREKTLQIVESLQAENERLKKRNITNCRNWQTKYNSLKAEAYKEFAKRLIEKLKITELHLCETNERTVTWKLGINDVQTYSDILLKELVGEEK